MVSRIRWSFQMTCTDQIYPPVETVIDSRSSIGWSMSVVRAHSKVIFITALHCVKLYMLSFGVWAIGQVSYTFITYKNAAIYVNLKFLLFFFVLMISYCCCLCSVHNYTWTTTKQNNNNKRNENKKIHVNWSFCSDFDSY